MAYELVKIEFCGFGARQLTDGVYFSANIPSSFKAGIKIIDLRTAKEIESIELSNKFSCGNVYTVLIKNLDMKNKGYLLYGDDNAFVDPYSYLICEAKKGIFLSVINDGLSPKDFDEDVRLNIPYSESVFYLAHVKGLTKTDESIKKGKGTFSGLISKADYLKNLGVTAVILMPIYEFAGSNNYWGFGDAYYFAVKSDYSFAKNAAFEFKEFVKAYHDKGLEVILLLNFGDNSTTSFILEVCRFYRENYHVDGFRFVGSSFDISGIYKDPFLKDCKMIFENVDIRNLSFDIGAKYKHLALINDTFLNNTRRFLKGDDDLVPYISYSFRENSNNYGLIRNITDFRTLTLWDLVSFNRKHNEDNGEDNLDGTNYNFSWNCGEEGISKKVKVNKLRFRQVRNAAILSYLCQGAPMIMAGDEVLNSNNGNNNPYCQDNETGWVSWNHDADAISFNLFLKNLLAFRKKHVVLHQPKELLLFDYLSCKIPDVSFHGEEAFKMDQTPSSREFAIMYCGEYSRQYTKETEDSIYIAVNMHWEDRRFTLPYFGKEYKWYLLYSTDGKTDESFDENNMISVNKRTFVAKGRTISILVQKKI